MSTTVMGSDWVDRLVGSVGSQYIVSSGRATNLPDIEASVIIASSAKVRVEGGFDFLSSDNKYIFSAGSKTTLEAVPIFKVAERVEIDLENLQNCYKKELNVLDCLKIGLLAKFNPNLYTDQHLSTLFRTLEYDEPKQGPYAGMCGSYNTWTRVLKPCHPDPRYNKSTPTVDEDGLWYLSRKDFKSTRKEMKVAIQLIREHAEMERQAAKGAARRSDALTNSTRLPGRPRLCLPLQTITEPPKTVEAPAIKVLPSAKSSISQGEECAADSDDVSLTTAASSLDSAGSLIIKSTNGLDELALTVPLPASFVSSTLSSPSSYYGFTENFTSLDPLTIPLPEWLPSLPVGSLADLFSSADPLLPAVNVETAAEHAARLFPLLWNGYRTVNSTGGITFVGAIEDSDFSCDSDSDIILPAIKKTARTFKPDAQGNGKTRDTVPQSCPSTTVNPRKRSDTYIYKVYREDTAFDDDGYPRVWKFSASTRKNAPIASLSTACYLQEPRVNTCPTRVTSVYRLASLHDGFRAVHGESSRVR